MLLLAELVEVSKLLFICVCLCVRVLKSCMPYDNWSFLVCTLKGAHDVCAGGL